MAELLLPAELPTELPPWFLQDDEEAEAEAVEAVEAEVSAAAAVEASAAAADVEASVAKATATGTAAAGGDKSEHGEDGAVAEGMERCAIASGDKGGSHTTEIIAATHS